MIQGKDRWKIQEREEITEGTKSEKAREDGVLIIAEGIPPW